jgi:predicted lysophospholipase L1 biosynthesis ABC-type transport system permease subunit
MGTMAAIIGAIGGFCAVMGIITAAEVIPVIMPEFTWSFWFALSGILLLCSIAFTTGRSGD